MLPSLENRSLELPMPLLLSLVFLDLLRGYSLLEVADMFLVGFVFAVRLRAKSR